VAGASPCGEWDGRGNPLNAVAGLGQLDSAMCVWGDVLDLDMGHAEGEDGGG
jgi:hypothetical protein